MKWSQILDWFSCLSNWDYDTLEGCDSFGVLEIRGRGGEIKCLAVSTQRPQSHLDHPFWLAILPK